MAPKTPDPKESEQLAHDIGALFLNFGVLEHTLSRAVAAACGLTEKQERTFVRGMFARAKVELLQAYAKVHWNDKYQRELGQLARKALALIDYRNDFAHGTIMHDKDGKWAVLTFRGGDRFEGKAATIDLKALASKVTEAMDFAESFERLAVQTEEGKTARPVAPPRPHPSK